MQRFATFCFLSALFCSGAFAATMTLGSLADFVEPVVLDFEAAAPGPIAATDALFTAFGLSSVATSDADFAADLLDVNVDGNALGSVNGILSILGVGDAYDRASVAGGPRYTFEFTRNQTRLGVLIADQHDHDVVFSFSLDGASVGSYTFHTPATTEPLSAFTVYLLSDMPFDRVELSTGSLAAEPLGGYAVDNLTLDAVPEPSAVVLIGAGLVVVAFRSRRRRS